MIETGGAPRLAISILTAAAACSRDMYALWALHGAGIVAMKDEMYRDVA
jgi:hypothetical protein